MIYITNKTANSLAQVLNILKEDYQIDITKDDIIYNEHNKPYIKNNPYYFNISHHSNVLAIIIDNQEVGIDLEEVRPYNSGVAKKLFTDEEITYCQDDDLKFTEIFTKKESYGKYKGTGLGEYLKDINLIDHPLIKTITYNDYIISITNATNHQIKQQ